MQSRRDLLKQIGLATAAALVSAGTARVAREQALQAFVTGGDADKAPWWLVDPLGPGAAVGRGWVLADLSPVRQGAAVFTLQHRDGRQARVHLCARQGRPVGLAHTGLFDLVLMDGGTGQQPTDEHLGRAVIALARRVRRHELRDHANLKTASRLLGHDERASLYGPENLV